MDNEKMKVSRETIIRTSCLIVAIINQILTLFGISLIPINDEQINLFISTGFTIIISLITWWKDNDITQYAIKRKKVGEENVKK